MLGKCCKSSDIFLPLNPILLGCPVWPHTHSVAHAGLELTTSCLLSTVGVYPHAQICWILKNKTKQNTNLKLPCIPRWKTESVSIPKNNAEFTVISGCHFAELVRRAGRETSQRGCPPALGLQQLPETSFVPESFVFVSFFFVCFGG